MGKVKFKFLEHTADVKFQSFGKTIEEAYTNAALALKEAISGKVKIKGKIKKKISIKGHDKISLLYNFLEEFLYFIDAEDFALGEIKGLKITGNKLTAEIVGDKASDYKFTNDVKAITYNEMFVKKSKEKFICQVVVDV